jgi:hypothetical protein
VNAPVSALRFNLTLDRLDVYIGQALGSTTRTRHMRDRLIDEIRDGRLDHMLPRRRLGLSSISEALDRRAALNIVDFHFEPIVLPTMSTAQAVAYVQAIEKTLTFGPLEGAGGDGPLWVDTVHHACVFSTLHQLAAKLGAAGRIRRLILLHQGHRPEPRLEIVQRLLDQVHRIRLDFIKLEGRWFSDLARAATPDTAIFYLTDMPPAGLPRKPQARRALSETLVFAEPDVSLRIGTVSGSAAFARRLGATHAVLDYPASDRIRLRPYDPKFVATLCPLEDWAFWPLLSRPLHPLETIEAAPAEPRLRERALSPSGDQAPSYLFDAGWSPDWLRASEGTEA